MIVFDPDPVYWNEQLPGEISNRLVKLLIEVRSHVALRANDPQTIQCVHGEQDEADLRQVCVHILNGDAEQRYLELNDTTDRSAERLWCEACIQQLDRSQKHLRTICRDSCFSEFMNKKPRLAGVVGVKAVKYQPSPLQFDSSLPWQPFPTGASPLAIAPWEASATPCFLSLFSEGQMVLVDPIARSVNPLGNVDLHELRAERNDDGEPLELMMRLSVDGRYAAVCNQKGQYGAVFEMMTCRSTMSLNRQDYHVEHCIYPVAFIEHGQRTLLVHATNWNRLDISDPATGDLLTKRESPTYDVDSECSEHYLDYFHCQLHVSPNSKWIADTGWVWHPVGIVRLWNLHDWLHNCWESEDGQSVKDVAQRHYHWDAPACWINNETIAIWGYGDDDENMLDAVQFFDATSGKLIDWFAGPAGDLYFDRYLFSSDQKHGTQVWNIQTGYQLLHQPSLVITQYHRRSKTFLSINSTGGWSTHQLKEE